MVLHQPQSGKDHHLERIYSYAYGVLVATDFFTAEVWTACGLVTYYIIFFIHLANRKVHIAGITPHPDQHWMIQVARNVTMADWAFCLLGTI